MDVEFVALADGRIFSIVKFVICVCRYNWKQMDTEWVKFIAIWSKKEIE